MRIFDVSYLKYPNDQPEVWEIGAQWMKEYFNIQVDRDWDEPEHILGECPWFQYSRFQRIEIQPLNTYRWESPNDVENHRMYGGIIVIGNTKDEQVIEDGDGKMTNVKSGTMYVDKRLTIYNRTNDILSILIGQVQYDDIFIPLTGIIKSSSLMRNKRMIYLTGQNTTHNIVIPDCKKCWLINIDCEGKKKKHSNHDIGHYWIRNEELYSDHFDFGYTKKGIPDNVDAYKSDLEYNYYRFKTIGIVVIE